MWRGCDINFYNFNKVLKTTNNLNFITLDTPRKKLFAVTILYTANEIFELVPAAERL